MGHVQDNAEEAVRRVVSVLHDGCYRYLLDNGAVIEVSIAVDRDKREAVIDFSGTSAQLINNFNAPSAICMAAVLYVFRTLVDDDIPLNAGCLKPLKVVIPKGLDAEPGLSGIGGVGQCRDLELHHQCAIRRIAADGHPARAP